MAHDSTLLTCDLAKSGDEKNRLIIRSSSLSVFYKGDKEDISYAELKGIRVGHKKLIIPLVMGGIGTSFSMLALSLGWYVYEVNLLSVFLFFLWMYYGFNGSDALVVDVKGHQHIYLIRSNKSVVQEAINFLNERLWKIKSNNHKKLFHITDKKHWDAQTSRYDYEAPSLFSQGFIHLSEEEDLKETVALHIDPNSFIVLICVSQEWLLPDVRLEYVESRKKSMPHLYGELNKSAILWSVELKASELDVQYLETFT